MKNIRKCMISMIILYLFTVLIVLCHEMVHWADMSNKLLFVYKVISSLIITIFMLFKILSEKKLYNQKKMSQNNNICFGLIFAISIITGINGIWLFVYETILEGKEKTGSVTCVLALMILFNVLSNILKKSNKD